MSARAHKWLLVLIALALAVAPLRASWAMSAPDTTDNAPHCEQMQDDDNQSPDLSSGCCGENCNMSICKVCAYGALAIPNVLPTSTDASAPLLDKTSVYHYPERTITPPLRPPASL